MRKEKKNYYGMDNKELRELIVDDLKSLDLKRKDYSLRIKNVMYDLVINVTIKNPFVNILDVKEILEKYHYVQYDVVNFEILDGCNVYVDVAYDCNAFNDVAKKYESIASKKIKEVEDMRTGECIKAFENERWICYLGNDNTNIIAFVHSVITDFRSKNKIIYTVEELSKLMFKMDNYKSFGL